MEIQTKKLTKKILTFLVIGNTVLFLLLAYFHLLSAEAKDAVFIDFWGRFTVYSLWFIGFVAYEQYLSRSKWGRALLLSVVFANIPFFLLLAYFDRISNAPESIVFVDFWGRITVYSLWVLSYELYRKYVETEQSA